MHRHTHTHTPTQCLCLAQHLDQQAACIIGREAPAEGLLPQHRAQDSPANQPRTKQHSVVGPTGALQLSFHRVACCTCQAAPLLSEVKQSKVKRSKQGLACDGCKATVYGAMQLSGVAKTARTGCREPWCLQKRNGKCMLHAAINAAVAATPLGAARAKALHPSLTNPHKLPTLRLCIRRVSADAAAAATAPASSLLRLLLCGVCRQRCSHPVHCCGGVVRVPAQCRHKRMECSRVREQRCRTLHAARTAAAAHHVDCRPELLHEFFRQNACARLLLLLVPALRTLHAPGRQQLLPTQV